MNIGKKSRMMAQKSKCSTAADKAPRHAAAVRRDCGNDAARNPEAYESWPRFCLEHPDALLAKAAAFAAKPALARQAPLDNNSILILQILERQAAFGF
jgi:hypothetical protein